MASCLEALLFASAEPLTLEKISEVCQVTLDQVQAALDLLQSRYRAQESALEIVDVAGGKQLRTRSEFFPWISRLQLSRPVPLSNAAMESLAIILYKQPITRVEIDSIRGVNSASAIHTLLEKGLIQECGRLEVPGRPILYETTDEALQRLGLASLDDLPPLETIASQSPVPQISFPVP